MDAQERILTLARAGFGDRVIAAMLDADVSDLAAVARDPSFPVALGETATLGPLTVGLIEIPDEVVLGPTDGAEFGGPGATGRILTPPVWNTPPADLGSSQMLLWSIAYDIITDGFLEDGSADVGQVIVESVDPAKQAYIQPRPDLSANDLLTASNTPGEVTPFGWSGLSPRWNNTPSGVLAQASSSISGIGQIRIQAFAAHINAAWANYGPPLAPVTFRNFRFAYLGL